MLALQFKRFINFNDEISSELVQILDLLFQKFTFVLFVGFEKKSLKMLWNNL